MRHLLSIEQLGRADLDQIFQLTTTLKAERGRHPVQPLSGKFWALLFSKSSTRTRVSFEVGIRELGGTPMFLNAGEIQLGRGEPVKDTARVLGRMVHGAVIRTYDQQDLEEFARYSNIPIVNALTDAEHPCQILADIFSFQEKRGSIRGKTVAFIGDGFCNVAVSWLFAAAKIGFELRIAAPGEYQPPLELLTRAGVPAGSAKSGSHFEAELGKEGGRVICTDDIKSAASGADLLYTDVWVSMGKEAESGERIDKLSGYQINQRLVRLAKPEVLVMHCLPAYRGKEIDEPTFEAHASTIFDQAENRLHAQKAALSWLVG
jgi:ornithine carbamoyltransferase